MNRVYTTIALQSVAAAVIIAASPLALAGTATHSTPAVDPGRDHVLVTAPFVSTVSREQVRAEAVAAARRPLTFTDSQHEPQLPAFASTMSRAQVHAEAVETVRLGLTGSYEDQKRATPEQLAQIRRAGELAKTEQVAQVSR